MATTYFQTFIDAFATLDPRSRLLAGDEVLWPPRENSGYQSTPTNAVTFASMGVDGVHYVILKIDGQVRDDSPVAQVSPMDSNDITMIADSFLSFLADGCKVSKQKMKTVLDGERAGKRGLVAVLSEHFDLSRLLGEERTGPLMERYGHLIER